MSFTADSLDRLKLRLSKELSEKRYAHTLGVLEAALQIAEHFPELPRDELAAAALLHDAAKELTESEQIRLAVAYLGELSDEELASPQILHSLAAPMKIREDFPEFATPCVISAVLKHTTGSEDMSLFDKVIFIADYVEAGRSYLGCIRVREGLFRDLDAADTHAEREQAINRACLCEIDETIASLRARGLEIDSKTLRARSVIASII